MFDLVAAFVLDRVFGAPASSWPRVGVMGRGIRTLERWTRFLIPGERVGGFLLAVLIPALTGATVWFLGEIASQIHSLLGKAISIYFIYSAIAVKDLKHEARRIYAALTNRKLESARKNLGRIVGRDTENLGEEEIIRGAVEAVAESFVDGVLAPLFYAALGGAPLAMVYKAINTMDSMVGLRTPRYQRFGSFAAKLDDVVNWIPARISWVLIGMGTAFINGRSHEAWRIGWEDGANTDFSNACVPEAAFAGALGVELGGTNFYGGEKVETHKLGYPMRPLQASDIRTAYRLMLTSAWCALIFAVLLRVTIKFFTRRIIHPL